VRFSKYDFGSVLKKNRSVLKKTAVFGSVFLKIAVIGSVFSLLPSDV